MHVLIDFDNEMFFSAVILKLKSLFFAIIFKYAFLNNLKLALFFLKNFLYSFALFAKAL